MKKSGVSASKAMKAGKKKSIDKGSRGKAPSKVSAARKSASQKTSQQTIKKTRKTKSRVRSGLGSSLLKIIGGSTALLAVALAGFSLIKPYIGGGGLNGKFNCSCMGSHNDCPWSSIEFKGRNAYIDVMGMRAAYKYEVDGENVILSVASGSNPGETGGGIVFTHNGNSLTYQLPFVGKISCNK